MSNSPLVSYTKISPNKNSPRNKAVDRITPHCVVGQCTVERIGEIFASSTRQASSNYGIGLDGKIGMYCDERDRSWCSSSGANDNRAITIECASDTKAPYAMNTKVYSALIDLCVDICQRYGKTKLLWLVDKDKTLSYTPKKDEMILTVHRWFANKSCPGDWLYSRLGDLAAEVTKRLSGGSVAQEGSNTTPSTKPTTEALYRVQVGAYKQKSNADAMLAKLKAAGFDGFTTKVGDLYKVQVGAYRESVKAENFRQTVKQAGFPAMVVKTSTGPQGGPQEDFTPYRVQVHTPVLNVRQGPSTGAVRVGSVRQGEVLTIAEESTGQGATLWGKVENKNGWISLDFVKKV
jgi:hypothetical protein